MALLMAVPKPGRVTVYLRGELNNQGNPTTITRTFSSIRSSAADEQVFEVAKVLSDLMEHDLRDISRIEISDLVGA